LRGALAVADLDATKRELQRNGVDVQVNDGVLSTPPAAWRWSSSNKGSSDMAQITRHNFSTSLPA
jgi:hypothetical protein